MVECDLPKVEIAGSSPVSRSMVTKAMFWKKFYFVVILLSCNCFLLCSNGFCKLVKEIFCCGQSETTNDSDNGPSDNQDNNIIMQNDTNINNLKVLDNNNSNNNSVKEVKKNNIDINNILLNVNNKYNWGGTDLNDSGKLYDKFKNIDFSKLELISGNEDLLKKCRMGFKTLFCSATDYRVGKTSIVKVAKEPNFDAAEINTVGFEFFSFYFKTTDNTLMKMQVWDIASGNQYQSLTKDYYNKTNAIIFVYDITNRESFNNLEGYIKEVKKEAEKVAEGCLFFLLGNKLDLIEQKQNPKERQVTIDEAKNFAESNDLIFLGECSAKENRYMPVAENTCYKQENLQDGNCLDGVSGIFKDILSNIVKKQKFQGNKYK